MFMLKVFFVVCLFFGNFAFAKQSEKNDSTVALKRQAEILAEINGGLAKITDMKIGFRQSVEGKAENGFAEFKSGHGIFIKYKTMPITLLANKDITVYYDSKMDEKSEIPTKDSATKIFTGLTQIDDKMFDIISVSETNEAYSVVAVVKKMKAEGIITMYFSKSDLLIRRVDIDSPQSEKLRIDIFSHNFETVSVERFKAINIKNENL
jgi:outer membrane lipoprotein-sorting protein